MMLRPLKPFSALIFFLVFALYMAETKANDITRVNFINDFYLLPGSAVIKWSEKLWLEIIVNQETEINSEIKTVITIDKSYPIKPDEILLSILSDNVLSSESESRVYLQLNYLF